MRFGYLLIALIAIGAACIILAMASGPYPLSFSQLIDLVVGVNASPSFSKVSVVFWQIRLPRILSAMLIGAALAAAGTAYQGMFRNPLVSPDILGVSTGAGLGACFAIWLGMSIILIQGMAFIGGLLVVFCVWTIARRATYHEPVLTLVLVGIALGTVCGAGISLIKILADPYTQLPSITFWLLGGLASITLADLKIAFPCMLMGLIPLVLLRWRLNLLSLSDDEAQAMGINVARMRLVVIISATLMTASAVAIAGVVGWVGLIVPHIGRLLIGSNHQRLLPVSMAVGAILLLLTDTLARTVTSTELPLGILTAFIGAPFFLLLLLRGRRI